MLEWLMLAVPLVVLVAYLVWEARARRWSEDDDELLAAQAAGERLADHIAEVEGIDRSLFTVEVHRARLCWHPHHVAGRLFARARRRFLAWVARVDARSRGG